MTTANPRRNRHPAAFAKATWQLNPSVYLHFFHYDPADLETLGGEPLAKTVTRLQQEPGQHLLLRVEGRNDDRSTDDPFARMLQMATNRTDRQKPVDQLDPQEGEEMALLAVEQGILQLRAK